MLLSTLILLWHLKGRNSCGIASCVSSSNFLLGWLDLVEWELSGVQEPVLTIPWICISVFQAFVSHPLCALAPSAQVSEPASISAASKNIDFFFFYLLLSAAQLVCSLYHFLALSNNWIMWSAWPNSVDEITRKLKGFRGLAISVSWLKHSHVSYLPLPSRDRPTVCYHTQHMDPLMCCFLPYFFRDLKLHLSISCLSEHILLCKNYI